MKSTDSPQKYVFPEGIKNGFLSLFAIIFILGVLEIILRCCPSLYSAGYQPSSDDRLVFELRPRHYMASRNAHISAQGLNDRIFAVNKASGVYRVAVLGDSTSFGWKVGAENSFPKVLERKLNENSSPKYEVMNFSVPGYNTAQELDLLKTKVLKFKPDLVILVFCGNDMNMCNYIKPKITFLNFLYNKSYVIHFIVNKLDSYIIYRHPKYRKLCEPFKKNVLGMYYSWPEVWPDPGLEETIFVEGNPPSQQDLVPQRYWYMLGPENYKKHLSEFIAVLKQNNIEFISSGLFFGDARKINKKLGVRMCDFNDHFSQDKINPKDIALSAEDTHMNLEGHRLCAQYLYQMIAPQ